LKNLLKTFLFLIWSILPVLYPYGSVQGKAGDGKSWQSLETKYTIIQYQSPEDLKRFDKKIDYPPEKWGIKRLFAGSDPDHPKERLIRKIDALFERAQEILDMRKRSRKVTINIYSNKEQLKEAYKKVFKRSFRTYKSHPHPRAWYIHAYKTIYINVDDLYEGMLAHEMAHSIIDNYLLVRPPEATSEILARYVDAHLFD